MRALRTWLISWLPTMRGGSVLCIEGKGGSKFRRLDTIRIILFELHPLAIALPSVAISRILPIGHLVVAEVAGRG